ncbi:NAD(P)/FAD-dependent oxidoreductase [soil metagenome]
MNKKLVIIGGGAAGFFCAVNAATPWLDIVIVEKTNKLLSKVKVSGGRRCNVTHNCSSISEMIKNYPRGGNFLKKAFHHFFTTDTISWFEKRGVQLKTERDGRMFPVTDSSQTIIDALMREVNEQGIKILMNKDVQQIRQDKGKFKVIFKDGNIDADFVCIACGGFAKASQFEWIRQLGHSVEIPVPSLFTFNITDDPIKNLMGISVEKAAVKIMSSKYSYQGPLLITHWGFSGPAVLKLSSFAARELAEKHYDFIIQINWLPDIHEQHLREEFQKLRFRLSSQKIINRNPFNLPARLWEYLLIKSEINENVRWADLPSKQQNQLISNISACRFHVKGKTTFKEEFVTSGGIQLSEIEVNTMESKIVKNLFFAGEIMNVDGITGGFNFQHAWSSGWIAAMAIKKYLFENGTN